MMQSSILRARAPISRLACRIPSSSTRPMGTYATFKIPQINNEPNVGITLQLNIPMSSTDCEMPRNTTFLVHQTAKDSRTR